MFDGVFTRWIMHACDATVDCEPPFGAAGVLYLFFFGADGDDDDAYGDTSVGDCCVACFADAAGCGAGPG